MDKAIMIRIEQEEKYVFHWQDDETFYEALEENLYVIHELEPIAKDWRKQALLSGKFKVKDYYENEAEVMIIWADGIPVIIIK